MKKLFNQYQKLLFCMCAAGFVIAGGLYYFGIQRAFVPNSEDLSTVRRWYVILNMDQPYVHDNIIFDLISCLSVMIGEMSYFSIRLDFTLLYMLVLCFSLYLSIPDGRKTKRWYILPIWAFFMILVHTVRSGSDFAKVYDDTNLIWQLPYNYHMAPLIFALLSMIILQCYLNAGMGKRKNCIGGIGIIIILYALLHTDLVYYVIFAVPLLIVLVIRALYNNKIRKYILPVLAAGVGIILLTRVLPGTFFEKLWSKETIDSPYGAIYGNTAWLNPGNILTHFENYVRVIMLLFNIDISNRPIISFYSILYVVRIAFVIAGYGIIIRIVICSIKGKAQKNGYTVTDEVLAWGFVMLSCAFIFTRNAWYYRDSIRYYAGLVPLLTVLLCRHIDDWMKGFLPIFDDTVRHKRAYFAGIMLAMCVCYAEPVWLYEVEDSYQKDCETAIEWLKQWGADSNGYALAPYWLSARLSAMTGGEIIFHYDEQWLKNIYGEDADMRYMVVGWDDRGLLTFGLNKIAYNSYDEMCEKFKAPVRAVDLEYMYVCEFGK
ncbi:MAG: hypothetical protein NC337_02895 [Roseburia sp.]|nr:hypothetical protein [Roseburia sp.]